MQQDGTPPRPLPVSSVSPMQINRPMEQRGLVEVPEGPIAFIWFPAVFQVTSYLHTALTGAQEAQGRAPRAIWTLVERHSSKLGTSF